MRLLSINEIADISHFLFFVEISTDNVICRYCGLGSVDVNKGDSIDVGKKVGTIGAVPFEAGDENHIHIEVKIDGKYADPLSFINNNE